MKKLSILLMGTFIALYAKSMVTSTLIIKNVTLQKDKKTVNIPLKTEYIHSKNGLYTILFKKPIKTQGVLSIVLKEKNNKEFKIKLNSKDIIKDKITFKLYSEGNNSRDQDKYVAEVKHF